MPLLFECTACATIGPLIISPKGWKRCDESYGGCGRQEEWGSEMGLTSLVRVDAVRMYGFLQELRTRLQTGILELRSDWIEHQKKTDRRIAPLAGDVVHLKNKVAKLEEQLKTLSTSISESRSPEESP